jgi:aspartyl protease family protein
MALSAGARQAIGMATGWLAAAATVAVGLNYSAEIHGLARGGLAGAPVPAVREDGIGARKDRPVAPMHAATGREIQIRAGAHGHYFARAEINGRPVDVLVDTGASIVALAFDDARQAGVFVRDSDYTQRVSTANGYARVAPVILDRVSIGDITVRNVPAAVSEPGSLATTLLGMSFPGRLQRVDMRSGTLVLQE